MTGIDVGQIVAMAARGDGNDGERFTAAMDAVMLARHVDDTLALLDHDDTATFVAKLLTAGLEETSRRVVCTLAGTDGQPDDHPIRTPRIDTPAGAALAARCRELVGSTVIVHKSIEQIGSDRSMRLLVWLEPAGTPPPTPTQAASTSQATETKAAPADSASSRSQADLDLHDEMTGRARQLGLSRVEVLTIARQISKAHEEVPWPRDLAEVADPQKANPDLVRLLLAQLAEKEPR